MSSPLHWRGALVPAEALQPWREGLHDVELVIAIGPRIGTRQGRLACTETVHAAAAGEFVAHKSIVQSHPHLGNGTSARDVRRGASQPEPSAGTLLAAGDKYVLPDGFATPPDPIAFAARYCELDTA